PERGGTPFGGSVERENVQVGKAKMSLDGLPQLAAIHPRRMPNSSRFRCYNRARSRSEYTVLSSTIPVRATRIRPTLLEEKLMIGRLRRAGALILLSASAMLAAHTVAAEEPLRIG